MTDVVGRVLGTDDATPLEFWVAIAPGSHLHSTTWWPSTVTCPMASESACME